MINNRKYYIMQTQDNNFYCYNSFFYNCRKNIYVDILRRKITFNLILMLKYKSKTMKII